MQRISPASQVNFKDRYETAGLAFYMVLEGNNDFAAIRFIYLILGILLTIVLIFKDVIDK